MIIKSVNVFQSFQCIAVSSHVLEKSEYFVSLRNRGMPDSYRNMSAHFSY
jgi:hypothetical protein